MYSIQTMMTPSRSEVVSFCIDSFHVTTWTAALWPSSDWFIDKLLGAAIPAGGATAVDTAFVVEAELIEI